MKSLLEPILRTHKAMAFIFLALPFAASATSITWTNAAGGNWSAAVNWSPAQVPTAADDVSLIGGSYTLTVDVPAFANSLTMGDYAPTLGGTGPVTLGGPLYWTNGTISTVIYCNGGTVDNPHALDGGQIINSGTMTWIPYPFTGDGSVISNTSTGIMNIQISGSRITYNSLGGSSYFYNAGQITAAGSDTGIISDTFINTGSLVVSNGTLLAGAGGTNSGTMTAQASGTVGIDGEDFYFTDSSVLSGSGNFLVSDGTANVGGALNISGSWTVSGGTANFTGTSSATGQTLSISSATANFAGTGPWTPGIVNFSGNTLAGPSPILASGALNWTGGTITGIISCNGGTVNDPEGIDGGQLINYGLLNWIPYPYTGGGSVISNAPTGTISMPLNAGLFHAIHLAEQRHFTTQANSTLQVPDPHPSAILLSIVARSTFKAATSKPAKGSSMEPGSTLAVTVNAPTSLATFGISGPATLGGILDLNFTGYTPHTGDSFTPVTYASRSDVFGAFILPQQVDWSAVYGPTSSLSTQ